ncbi:hypothetical protein LTR85_003474 [Meristemomyces frigidus]|nr:hypothetical protein LTR85_003474 [Meristemomyces frigidus]
METTSGRHGSKTRRSASTSSDILVSGSAAPLAEVKQGVLIVRLGKEALLTVLSGDDGPNERGTYSRQYTLRHPEVQWVHRGQGRYLPAEDVKREAAPVPQRRSRHSRPQQDATDESAVKAEAQEDNDDDFLMQEQIRAVVAKRVNIARSAEEELKVRERLQAIANKRNAGKRNDPAPQPQKRGRPPAWMMKLVHDGVMSRLNIRRNPSSGVKPRQQFPASPSEDLSNLVPILPERSTYHEPDREEISASRLDKFRSYVDRLILVESDAGSTIATFDEETQSPAERPPRKRRAIVDTLSDSLTLPPTYGLRHRLSEPQTPSGIEERAARLARRAKPVQSIEKSSRAALRSQYSATSQGVFSDSEEDDSDNMAEEGDKTPTYSREYVEQHGPENFHHTGNGWYKRGPRPQVKIKDLKERRNSDGLTLRRERDGSFTFDGDRKKSIHKEELEKYPGVEFHHCGNGYYRLGPDPAGKRSSYTVPDPDAEDDDAAAGGTVSKEYKEAHPELQWVHRGNGRYVRKADVIKESAPAPVLSETPTAPSATGRRKSEPTFDKAYVHAHPDEEFYHTGNARYKRGSKPNGKLNLPEEEEEEEDESEEEEDDPTTLYDKAYVEAHPHQTFHHRGQGRYARGPRPINTPARAIHEVDDESDDDMMPDTSLVDTKFVDSHPNLTFYHKGQGRWARGLPPPGSHNKVAVRGPGAKERMAARGSEEEEDEAEKAPALTALVTKGEGPEKFPTLTWHYRGGGKWGRITKQEAAQMNSGTAQINPATVAKFKRRSTKASDGPDAQLEREAAAAAGANGGRFADGDMEIDPAPAAEKPKQRRGRNKHRTSYQLQDELADPKDVSKPHSKPASPPKPRVMLRPEEDIITEEDLPPVFGANWEGFEPPDDSDVVTKVYRHKFKPIEYQKMCDILNRHSPEVRSMDTLNRIAAYCGNMLAQLQEEYLALDQEVAPHAKIPRKPAKGGRQPVDPAVFEDRKEADLYDYVFDPRKIGFQDPEAQRIVRDAEGRELRKRRNRSGIEPTDTVPGWHFGEGAGLASKRQSRQPNRFDGVIEPSRKRARTGYGNGNVDSMTPDRAATPLLGPGGYRTQTAGRWAGHVPKRVRELRENSVGSARSQNDGASESGVGGSGGKVRKGRPPGSKNLHKRSDAGIKKGPRRPKAVPEVVQSVEGSPVAGGAQQEQEQALAVDWEGGDTASELAEQAVAMTEKGGMGEKGAEVEVAAEKAGDGTDDVIAEEVAGSLVA